MTHDRSGSVPVPRVRRADGNTGRYGNDTSGVDSSFMTTSDLELLFLGPPRILRSGTLVGFDTRRAPALAAYLALAGGPVARERLVALLWPEYPPDRAFANLRRTLSALRSGIGTDAIVTRGQGIGLVDGVFCDAVRLRNLAAAIRTGALPVPGPDEAAQVLDLYRGEFLEGFSLPDSAEFDTWQLSRAEELRGAALLLSRSVLDAMLTAGNLEAAMEEARRASELDPTDPELMATILEHLGPRRPAFALRVYDRYRTTLAEDLGADPEPTLDEAAARLRSGSRPPAAGATASPPRPESGFVLGQEGDIVGRDAEVARVEQMLVAEGRRLVTIVGPGGIGKTRLALEAVRRLSESRKVGFRVALLAAVGSAGLVSAAIADAVGLGSANATVADIAAYLRDKRLVLVLDNFEHVIDAREAVGELIGEAGGLQVLVTSREPLGLATETLFLLEALPLPAAVGEGFEDNAAVRLFRMASRQVSGSAAPSEICGPEDLSDLLRLTAGLPLAITLAASWTPVLGCADIAEEIRRTKRLAASPYRALPERHSSLRAVYDSSLSRLQGDLAAGLSRLSLFAGPFSADAAGAVTGLGRMDLALLVARSLVRSLGDGRFEVHELLRQFAEDRLAAEVDEHERTVTCFLDYYTEHLRAAAGRLRGSEQGDALAWIQDALPHIRGAWRLAVDGRRWNHVDGILSGLSMFYMIRRRSLEAKEVFEYAVSATTEADCPRALRIGVALLLASTYRYLGRMGDARRAFGDIEADLESGYRQLPPLYALLVADLGSWPGFVHAKGVLWAERAVELSRAGHDRWCEAFALRLFGGGRHNIRDIPGADAAYRESLSISREIGDRWGEGYSSAMLGELAIFEGDTEAGERYYREGYERQMEAGDLSGAAWDLGRLAAIASHRGDYPTALERLTESLAMEREIGRKSTMGARLRELADLHLDMGSIEDARRCLDAASTLHAEPINEFEVGYLSYLRARLAIMTGQGAEAMAAAHAAIEHFAAEGGEWGRSLSYRVRGVARRLGREAAGVAAVSPEEVSDLRRALDVGASVRFAAPLAEVCIDLLNLFPDHELRSRIEGCAGALGASPRVKATHRRILCDAAGDTGARKEESEVVDELRAILDVLAVQVDQAPATGSTHS